MTFTWLAVAAAGLVVGSFLNVVIHRVPRDGAPPRPGPDRRAPIRGRLVELATAGLFGAVAARFGLTPALPAFLYLTSVAVALAVIDLDVRRLPNRIVLPSYLVGAVLLIAASGSRGDWPAVPRGLAAMAVLFAGYFALAWVYPGGMGFGDVKLAGLIGLYLGWLGWSAVWLGTLTGFLLGGLAAAVLLATRRAGRRTAIPFGPAMLAGALFAVIATDPVVA
jgi:leader peptidase (prepilin peptidase)/N-methyltransferase